MIPVKLTTLVLTAALAAAPLAAQAQTAPNAGRALPNLLTGLGGVANPLLQPVLGGLTAPVAAQAIPQLVPPLASVLSGLLGGPLNQIGAIPLGGLPQPLREAGGAPAGAGLGALGLPLLPGLE